MVEIRDLDAGKLLWLADRAQVVLDVGGEVLGERREQDAATPGQVPREPARAMHGDHRLAGAGRAQHPCGTVPRPLHQPPLRRVQKNPPALQWCVEHRLELQLVLDHHEAAARVVSRQRRREVLGVDRFLWSFPFPHEILVALARQIEEQRLVRLQRQAGLHAVQIGIIAHRAYLGQHGGRDSESGQLAVPQVAEGQRWNGSVGRCLDRRRCLGIRFGARLVHLQCAGLGVDAALVSLRPRVGVVVLVGPQQHVDVAVLRLEHDRPVALIDTQRSHGWVAGRVDPLLVQAAGRGVGVEPGDEGPNAALLRPG